MHKDMISTGVPRPTKEVDSILKQTSLQTPLHMNVTRSLPSTSWSSSNRFKPLQNQACCIAAATGSKSDIEASKVLLMSMMQSKGPSLENTFQRFARRRCAMLNSSAGPCLRVRPCCCATWRPRNSRQAAWARGWAHVACVLVDHAQAVAAEFDGRVDDAGGHRLRGRICGLCGLAFCAMFAPSNASLARVAGAEAEWACAYNARMYCRAARFLVELEVIVHGARAISPETSWRPGYAGSKERRLVSPAIAISFTSSVGP